MYCKKCGSEITEKQCKACGQSHKEFINEIEPDSQEKNNSEELLDDNTPNDTACSPKDIFLESDEVALCTMSRGYISNYVLGGNLSSDIVVLTSKRVYYSGGVIGSTGKSIGKLKGQVILPLDKISSLSFIEIKKTSLLVIAIVWLILGVVIGFMFEGQTGGASFLSVFPSVIFYFAYLFSISRSFVISTDTASTLISYKLYGKDAICKFSRMLGAAMTNIRAKGNSDINLLAKTKNNSVSSTKMPRSNATNKSAKPCCTFCNAKADEDAFYCVNCGEVVWK